MGFRTQAQVDVSVSAGTVAMIVHGAVFGPGSSRPDLAAPTPPRQSRGTRRPNETAALRASSTCP
jgi:hypothetical protein